MKLSIESIETYAHAFKVASARLIGDCPDPLDLTTGEFERSFVEFQSNVSELETVVVTSLSESIKMVASAVEAFELFENFEEVVRKSVMRSDVHNIYNNLFHRLHSELKDVQDLYERQKKNPPVVRNVPPVASNIAWARTLMRRIEIPMRKCKSLKSAFAESKVFVRLYAR